MSGSKNSQTLDNNTVALLSTKKRADNQKRHKRSFISQEARQADYEKEGSVQDRWREKNTKSLSVFKTDSAMRFAEVFPKKTLAKLVSLWHAAGVVFGETKLQHSIPPYAVESSPPDHLLGVVKQKTVSVEAYTPVSPPCPYLEKTTQLGSWWPILRWVPVRFCTSTGMTTSTSSPSSSAPVPLRVVSLLLEQTIAGNFGYL
ncbi:hypothetical protein R3P38DRAFT_2784452 [Favolaschia claudopus]|uniref:Uncharacterized protein n=1 Tax=Favolaschia claudopus TaxID=2862362 RepID=A0AAW0AWZ9_9AGAR